MRNIRLFDTSSISVAKHNAKDTLGCPFLRWLGHSSLQSSLRERKARNGIRFAFAAKSCRGDHWSPAGVQCTPLRCSAVFSLLGRGVPWCSRFRCGGLSGGASPSPTVQGCATHCNFPQTLAIFPILCYTNPRKAVELWQRKSK